MDAVDVLIEDHTHMQKSMKELATMQQPGLTRTSVKLPDCARVHSVEAGVIQIMGRIQF